MDALVFNLEGDEETAASFMGTAQSMHRLGQTFLRPDSMTTIRIAGNVATITVEMDTPYHILIPKTVADNPGFFTLQLAGYSHRKDAVVPVGEYEFPVTGPEGAYTYGPEVAYISDGLAMVATGVMVGPQYQWLPNDYTVAVAIGSTYMEDAVYAVNGGGTHGGFPVNIQYIPMSRVVLKSGDNTYFRVPYGVVRTDPEAPTYYVLLGHLDRPDTTEYNMTQNSSQEWVPTPPASALIRYTGVSCIVTLLIAGKAGTSASSYFFGYDMYSLPVDGVDPLNISHDYAAHMPPVFPVGNMGAVLLYRERTPLALRPYGGTFTVKATYIAGYPPTGTSLSIAGLAGTYFNVNTGWISLWHRDYEGLQGQPYTYFGPIGFNLVFIPYDSTRWDILFHTIGKHLRSSATPISNTETIFMGVRTRCNKVPTMASYGAELVCLKVTPSGFSQQGVVFTYWSSHCPQNDAHAANARRLRLEAVRCVHIGGATIILFYTQYVETAVFTGVYTMDNRFRRVSTDNGVTWSAAEVVAFSGVDAYWTWSKPIAVRTGLAPEDTPMVAGYISMTPVGGTSVTLEGVGALRSEDGGATWVRSAEVIPGLDYTTDLDYYGGTTEMFTNGDGGTGAMQNHGCWEDGFEPSPYKHLPNYFGTPRGICRDSTGDPNL